jgi:hypothetical protein
VKGNERADRLADLAVGQGGVAMDSIDLLNILRDNYRTSEAANYSECISMIMLNELYVKAGSARQKTICREVENNCKPA